jgi:hypothetical protein
VAEVHPQSQVQAEEVVQVPKGATEVQQAVSTLHQDTEAEEFELKVK